MRDLKEEIENKLLKLDKIKMELEVEDNFQSEIHFEELPSLTVKLDKVYLYNIFLGELEFELKLHESDGIIIHQHSILHVFKYKECPFCENGILQYYSKCNVLGEHLTSFLLFILKKHPKSRIRLLNDSVFQGKEILSIIEMFKKMNA